MKLTYEIKIRKRGNPKSFTSDPTGFVKLELESVLDLRPNDVAQMVSNLLKRAKVTDPSIREVSQLS